MSKKAVCTISTKSYLFKSLALAESIHQIDSDLTFIVLMVDEKKEAFQNINYTFGKIEFYDLQSISNISCANKIIKKYSNKVDFLRWSLKPILLQILLTQKGFE